MEPLKTDRLLLRAWTYEDVPALYAYAKDERVGPQAGWRPHKSLSESKDIVKMFIDNGDVYAIEWCETGEVIGSIGLHQRKIDEASGGLDYELGYVLNPDYWGRGIMVEAAKACMASLKAQGVEHLWCAHFDFNANSKRVIEKLGFEYIYTREKRLENLDNRLCQTLYYKLKL